MNTPEEFWAHVEPTGFCWEWRGARSSSLYGHLKWQGRLVKAHRLAYELLIGSIPFGLTLDHLCRNPGCVNPDHLDPTTHKMNVSRGFSPSAQANREGRCLRGHLFTPENSIVKRSKPGKRECRTCDRAAQARRRAARLGPTRIGGEAVAS